MVPSWLQAIVLGVVQGLAEFIPVSSSGHLVLVPYLLSWERPGLAFDVALHMGTALAVIVYFRAELLAMARGLLLGDRTPEGALYRRIAVLLAIASLPVAVVGLTLQSTFEAAFASPGAAASFLFVTALLLVAGERLRARRIAHAPTPPADGPARPPSEGDRLGERLLATQATALPTGHDDADPTGLPIPRLGLRHALIVGVGQTLALFPGVSRSGATITAGVAAGLTREAATRFSFLLSLPALAGAAILSLPDLREPGVFSRGEILLGVLAAFVSGYLAIRFLVALVARAELTGFAVYCVAAGIAGWVGILVLGAPA
jgi:undecaprenyl-diphosphatase